MVTHSRPTTPEQPAAKRARLEDPDGEPDGGPDLVAPVSDFPSPPPPDWEAMASDLWAMNGAVIEPANLDEDEERDEILSILDAVEAQTNPAVEPDHVLPSFLATEIWNSEETIDGALERLSPEFTRGLFVQIFGDADVLDRYRPGQSGRPQLMQHSNEVNAAVANIQRRDTPPDEARAIVDASPPAVGDAPRPVTEPRSPAVAIPNPMHQTGQPEDELINASEQLNDAEEREHVPHSPREMEPDSTQRRRCSRLQ